MSRFGAALRCDLRLQMRNGFYYAAGFVATCWMLGLAGVPDRSIAPLMAAFVFSNLAVNTFYFVAGLILLEQREGTLLAQRVTPLRSGEYLAAKVLTLAALALGENLLIVAVALGRDFRALPLVVGLVAAAAIYTLVGVVAVARYDSINAYLIPSVIYATLLSLPLLHYFGIVESPLFWLHPLQAPLVTIKAAFLPVRPGELNLAIAVSAGWIAVTFFWSRAEFRRLVLIRGSN